MMKLDEIGLSGKESDVESLQTLHRIRLLRHRVQNLSGQNHQSSDGQGVDQRSSPPLRLLCLYVSRVQSNHYNLNLSPISNEIINNKRRFIVL